MENEKWFIPGSKVKVLHVAGNIQNSNVGEIGEILGVKSYKLHGIFPVEVLLNGKEMVFMSDELEIIEGGEI